MTCQRQQNNSLLFTCHTDVICSTSFFQQINTNITQHHTECRKNGEICFSLLPPMSTNVATIFLDILYLIKAQEI